MNQHHQDLIVTALCQRFVKEAHINKEAFAKEATALIEAVALVNPVTDCGSVSTELKDNQPKSTIASSLDMTINDLLLLEGDPPNISPKVLALAGSAKSIWQAFN